MGGVLGGGIEGCPGEGDTPKPKRGGACGDGACGVAGAGREAGDGVGGKRLRVTKGFGRTGDPKR